MPRSEYGAPLEPCPLHSMFASLRTLLNKWFQPPPTVAEAEAASPVRPIPEFLKAHQEDSPLESCTLHLAP